MTNPDRTPSGLILADDALHEYVAASRGNGERIVFTNGCFDILHRGHVEYLATARSFGDRLIVGLNSDSSVTALKGPGRPLISEDDRAVVLAALRSVDVVTLFDEPTPFELIRTVLPDVLVKGGDYDPEATDDAPRYIVGSDIVRAHGGIVRVVNLVAGRSTSAIVERMRSSGG